MNERELIRKAMSGLMPDREAVRKKCTEAGKNAPAAEAGRNRRMKRLIPAAACLAAAVGILCAVPSVAPFLNRIGASVCKSGASAGRPAESALRQNRASAALAITVNEWTKQPSDSTMNIALIVNDFVKMDKQKLCDFYGFDVFPSAVPTDLSVISSQDWGVFRRNNGTGKVYYSQNVLKYENSSASRTLCIVLSKGRLPYTDIAASENKKDVKSEINGNDLLIAQYSASGNHYYYAQFLYRSVGYNITAKSLSKAELTNLLSSILR